jgi:hypothetical protein
MILMEVYICVSFSKVINPHHFILRLDFLGINPFCPQGNFVLLVVMDGSHLFHQAQEERNCISREVFACMSISC